MPYSLRYVFILLICTFAQGVFGQTSSYPNYPGQQQQSRPNLRDTGSTSTKTMTADQQLDSLRKHQDKKKDTVIFNSKFVRVTSERFLRDSTQLFPLDTSLNNYENYSPLYQPRHPTINLGNLGTDERSLLFEPSHTIGFDVGLHTLDVYMLNPWDINYYRTRVPYTQLYLVTGGVTEQIFKVTHAQNINPQLNIGFNLNYIGSRGYYSSSLLGQNVSDVNAAAFAWYESKNKRYNLLANLIYNNLKAPETGSILGQDTIYVEKNPLSKTDEPVRLPNTYENWKSGGFYLKQFYYIGHLDSLKKGSGGTNILPTQRVSYTLNYNARVYNFKQNDVDNYGVFPDYYYSSGRSRDSLTVQHLQNDFSYSFYFRSKAMKLKNEVKLDVGLTQDYYHYSQYVNDTTLNQYGNKVNQQSKVQNNSFQDITLKARFSYRLSDRISLEGNFQQIAQGRDFGDFLYDGKLTLAGGEKTGKIIFEGYTQSSSAPLIYTDWISNHFIFHNKFSNQKTSNVSFTYINDDLKLDLKAEYFLITDYLYFAAQPGGIDATPTQLGAPINLLKVSFGKSLSWRRWHFDNFLVYQKSDYQNTLRIPQLYNYSSLYYKTLLFNVLYSNIGINVRYNTPYVAPSYATGLGEFYNGTNITFSSYPIATVYFKATLQRTNFFVMYDYANQGLFSNGFYTVNRYPQMTSLLKIGVSWSFYN
jgi:hypothetical protein